MAPTVHPRPVYLKDDLLEHRVVKNDEVGCYLVAVNGTVNGFRAQTDGNEVVLTLTEDFLFHDAPTGTDWDLRGHRIRGQVETNLTPIAISDEYWFSWRFFHPDAEVVRI